MQTNETLNALTKKAEESMLGAMINAPSIIEELASTITSHDLYTPQHATIFQAVMNLWAANSPIDALTVANEASKLDQRIDPLTIFNLTQFAPPAEGALYHAEIVKEQAQRRGLTQLATHISQIANTSEPTHAIIESATQALDKITGSRAAPLNSFGDNLADAVTEAINASINQREQIGFKTGFNDLDSTLGGLKPGQMVIVAGRPGSGKSTLAVDIVRNLSIEQGVPTLIFSLEMGNREIHQRILAAEASMFLTDIANGKLSLADQQRLGQVAEKIGDAPLYVDDDPSKTMVDISATIRKYTKYHGVKLAVIDYLQLLNSGKPSSSRQEEVSAFSREIKLLAKACEIPIIAVAQLNRGVEQRGEAAKPRASDLRESGSLEQDADVILLVHRLDIANPDIGSSGEVELIVAKNRGGPTRIVSLGHELPMARFVNQTNYP